MRLILAQKIFSEHPNFHAQVVHGQQLFVGADTLHAALWFACRSATPTPRVSTRWRWASHKRSMKNCCSQCWTGKRRRSGHRRNGLWADHT